MLNYVRTRLHCLLLITSLAVAGCSRPSFPVPAASDSAAEHAHQMETIRAEIEQIPPPSRTRYLAIKSLSAWENPSLTVQGNMITVHVTLADANTTNLGNGGLLRPTGARRQELNVRTADLPVALNAIPQGAWPYGRVIAVEEAHDAPPAARPQLRRNMEAAIKLASDVGVVVYEWQEGGPALH